jgi:hypothetical protein
MSTTFTIYNCGTGYNRNSGDIVARLNRETASPHFVTDGPGSGGFKPGKGHNPGGKTTLGGLLGGSGVDSNVAAGVDAARQAMSEGKNIVNMCGWGKRVQARVC